MLRPNLNNSFHSSVIVPYVGGGQALATILHYGLNVIQSPTADWDSVKLPPAIAGSVVMGMVIGDINNYIAIFASDDEMSDTINEFSNNSTFQFPSIGEANSQIFIFVCKEDGSWYCNMGPA